jgi:hypothetical protein
MILTMYRMPLEEILEEIRLIPEEVFLRLHHHFLIDIVNCYISKTFITPLQKDFLVKTIERIEEIYKETSADSFQQSVLDIKRIVTPFNKIRLLIRETDGRKKIAMS